jgi:hypothetical protein
MQALDINQLLSINQAVVYTQIEDEIVMMDPDDGHYHGLNAVGALLFMRLEQKHMTSKEMAAYLETTYALSEDAAMIDVQAFVCDMLEKKFLIPSTH